jgi:hypothetical protein
MDMTLNIYFDDGFHGTLTHDDPRQIREWAELFSKPDFMRDCNIVSLTITQNGLEKSLQEAA